MLSLLIRLFIKEYHTLSSPTQEPIPSQIRQTCGILCGSLGIALNILLFAGKFLAGSLSHSIAITADAFNNLSDAGSSLVTLIGFKMASQKPDSDHPFGHGRIEYLSGLLVSIAILFMAFELIRSSVDKILHPQPAEYSLLTLVILAASIGVKLYMYAYNKAMGKKIGSTAMHATAADSLSDAVATTAVFFSTLIEHFIGLQTDGYCGVLVGLFIFYTGCQAAKETVTPLLGQAPSPEFIQKVEALVLSDEEIRGIHDIVVHDYGPDRIMLSLHAEVAADGNILLLHNKIDAIEHRLREELYCEAVIHMDPIITNDQQTNELKQYLRQLLDTSYPDVDFHDFRMVKDSSSAHLMFDLVIPFGYSSSSEEITAYLKEEIRQMDASFSVIIQVDRISLPLS